MKHIPNLFTLLNLFFGCIAIVFVLQNGIAIYQAPDGNQLLILPENTALASIFIMLAAVVDFLDGFVARMFKATSAMGKQLDSLADVVSFGVAPGMILYQVLRLSVAKGEDGLDASVMWVLPAFILPCAAAWRLAKFNLDDTQHHSFKGVPTPAVGLLIASVPMILSGEVSQAVWDLIFNKWFIYGLIFLLSYLMVSNIPLMGLKFRDFTVKSNLPKIILIVCAVILIILFSWLAVPLIFLLYIVLSLALKKSIA